MEIQGMDSLRACYALLERRTVDCWHEHTQTLPDRRERRGVGLRRAVSDPDDAHCAPAHPCPARGLQRPALDRARRGALAPAAQRLPALGGGLPADAALAGGGLVR